MLEGFDEERDTPSEGFQLFDHPRGVAPNSTGEVKYAPALFAVEAVLLVPDLPLQFRLLVVINSI
jgi:hypothetical protein